VLAKFVQVVTCWVPGDLSENRLNLLLLDFFVSNEVPEPQSQVEEVHFGIPVVLLPQTRSSVNKTGIAEV
jgi:hypothetical protein